MISRIKLSRKALAGIALSLPLPLSAQHVLEEIQVVATPRDQTAAEMAQPVAVLRDESLRRAQSTNLGETLAAELGVTGSFFGAGSSRPIIRGLAGARVKTMEDGIDSLDVSTVSVDHAVSVDPIVAEQIEIFRGPTTLLYGSGAVGGVVNTVTRRIPEYAPEDGLEAAFEIRADTVAEDRTGAFRLDGGGDAFAWHLDGSRRDADDYKIPEAAELHPEPSKTHRGVLENSNFDTRNLSAGGSWLAEQGFFGVSVSDIESNYGVPAHHAHEEGQEEAPARIELEQRRYDVKTGWTGLSGPVHAVHFRLGVSDYEHRELERGETGTVFTNDAYEGRLELLHAPWGAWDGAFGMQLAEREFSALGEEAFVPPVTTSTLGLFILEQRTFDRWELSLGARAERQEQVPSAAGLTDVDGTAGSVSLAAIRSFAADYALALHAAVAQRLPVAEELYADGPHLASGTFEIGDPAIGKETSRHMDVGIRKQSGDVTWSVTAFYTSFADFIFLRDTGTIDATTELPIFMYSQQNARVTGLEAELFMPVARLSRGELDLRLFTDYVRGELANGESLPRLPPLRAGVRIQYHEEERLVAGLEAVRHAEQDDIAAFETPTPGYTMVNVDLGWEFATDGDARFSLLFKGSNLLDEDARRHTSLVKEIAPLPGRNYSLGFRASF